MAMYPCNHACRNTNGQRCKQTVFVGGLGAYGRRRMWRIGEQAKASLFPRAARPIGAAKNQCSSGGGIREGTAPYGCSAEVSADGQHARHKNSKWAIELPLRVCVPGVGRWPWSSRGLTMIDISGFRTAAVQLLDQCRQSSVPASETFLFCGDHCRRLRRRGWMWKANRLWRQLVVIRTRTSSASQALTKDEKRSSGAVVGIIALRPSKNCARGIEMGA